MAVYSVYVPREAAPGRSAGLDKAVLTRDGFHWLAFLFPLLWLLFNRLWLALLLFLLVSIGLSAAAKALGFPEAGIGVAGLLLSFWVGLNASEILGWTSSRRGWSLADIVVASDKEAAERRFFERWLARPAAGPGATAPTTPAAAPARPPQPILGLFPEAGGTR